MTAIEELIAEGTPHGELWIGFTPDEEVGAGANLFDLAIFQADYADVSQMWFYHGHE